jgi:serine/threonine-protein kinase
VTGDDDDRPGGRGKWVWLTAAVVLLLLLGGGTWFLLADGNRSAEGAGSGTSSSQSTAGPTGIQLDPAAFIGRPADEVQSELEAAGLVVSRRPADGDVLKSAGQALDAGDVAGLDPAGVFGQPGTPVVLLVARTAYDPGGRETSRAPSPTSEATTSEQPSPTSAAPTPTRSTSASSSVDTPSVSSSAAASSESTTDVPPPSSDAVAADGTP